MSQSNVVQGLEWVRSLLQELEDEGVELPMGDYGVAYQFVEDAREALWDYTQEDNLACTSDDPNNHQGDTCPIHET